MEIRVGGRADTAVAEVTVVVGVSFGSEDEDKCVPCAVAASGGINDGDTTEDKDEDEDELKDELKDDDDGVAGENISVDEDGGAAAVVAAGTAVVHVVAGAGDDDKAVDKCAPCTVVVSGRYSEDEDADEMKDDDEDDENELDSSTTADAFCALTIEVMKRPYWCVTRPLTHSLTRSLTHSLSLSHTHTHTHTHTHIRAHTNESVFEVDQVQSYPV